MVLQTTSCLTWGFVAHQPARPVVLSCFLFYIQLSSGNMSQWTVAQVSSKLKLYLDAFIQELSSNLFNISGISSGPSVSLC